MLLYRRTSILESTAQTVVNTVNCVGVMGKGLAHAFKAREPEMFAAYKSICDRKLLKPGMLWLWQAADQWVLNFPTKDHWRQPSRLDWIELGLKKFVSEYSARGITEISFPRLGCGNGGLDWDDVRPLMAHYLEALDIPIYIHDHEVGIGLPEHLEAVAARLRAERVGPATFESFMQAIHRTAELTHGNVEEIGSERRFGLRVDDGEAVEIETGHGVLHYASDDLRAIWMSLLSGLVTRREAEWSHRTGGAAMLTILSVLPDTRPIEVQPEGDEPQIAIELLPAGRRNSLAPAAEDPLLLSWA